MKHIKPLNLLLLFSLLLNLLLGIYVCKRIFFILSGKDNTPDKECNEQCRYFRKVLKYEMNKTQKDQIVFLGNSLTEYNDWSEMFGDAGIKNRGIEGDNTIGILKRLEGIMASKPKKIFLEIGINDVLGYSHGYPLPENYDNEKIIANYEKIIATINTQSPETALFVQNILPVGEALDPDGNYNKRIRKLNQALHALSVKHIFIYIDLYQDFEEEGKLKKDFTSDGLHLNKKGYQVWKKRIERYVID